MWCVSYRVRVFFPTFFFLRSSNMVMLSDQLSVVVVVGIFYARTQTSRKNVRGPIKHLSRMLQPPSLEHDLNWQFKKKKTHTHTHTHMCTYIYLYIIVIVYNTSWEKNRFQKEFAIIYISKSWLMGFRSPFDR